MNLDGINKQVLALSDDERRQFVEWFCQNQDALFPSVEALNEEGVGAESMKAELLRRKQEYLDHPDRFRQVKTREELKAYFDEIRDEIRARASQVSPAAPGNIPPAVINGFEVIPAGNRVVTPELIQKLADL